MNSEETKQEMRELIEAVAKWAKEGNGKRTSMILLHDKETSYIGGAEVGDFAGTRNIISIIPDDEVERLEASKEREFMARLGDNKE